MKIIFKIGKNLIAKQITFYIVLILAIITSVVFVNHNYSFYERPIAKITEIVTGNVGDVKDRYGNEDKLFEQDIVAQLLNGENKGQTIYISSEYSTSGAFDHPYHIGNDVFIVIEKNVTEDGTLVGEITDLKRDKYLVLILWVFVLVLLLVGKRQGLFASISLGVNMIILSYALDIYVKTGANLLWVSGLLVILFTVISLLMVNGFNEKTYAAIVATLLGTFLALFVTSAAIWVTSGRGLYYEEMQFLTRPYKIVFLAGLFIGSLGAVMDVAISISSALFELYHKNNAISIKALKESGIDIGKDIMGTMTNILFFAYISGSIPTLILYIRNYSELGYTLSINLSLELARALAGGIGIVITIPIGLYTTLYFIHRKRVKS